MAYHRASGDWSRALLQMQSAVTAAQGDPQAIMDAVVEGALQVLPFANGAAVEMRDTDEGVCRAASGIAKDYIGYRQQITGSLFEHCINSGKTQICSDSETSPYVNSEAARRLGIRSIIVVAIPFEGRIAGVLKIFADQANSFDESDLLKAQLLAGPITAGLASMAKAHADRMRVAASARFEATFRQAAVGMAHVALDGRFILVNDCFCRIAGHSRRALIRGGFQQITHPDDLDADLDNVARLMAGETDHYSMEKRYVRADGELVWINLTVSLVREEAGNAGFFVAVIEDISARKSAEQHALYDSLTGLPNRRWLMSALDSLLSAPRENLLVVAYLDLDGFKSVNDRFGHQNGDQCLIDVAGALGSILRRGDAACRIAGDEFVILMPNITHILAMDMMRRAKSAIAAIGQNRPWTIGMSIGAVSIDLAEPATAADILIAADRLMYGAKRAKSSTPRMQHFTALLAA